MPTTVTVYSFKVYDGVSDSYIYPARKSTAERIKRIRGVILVETAQEVPVAELDDGGRHEPPTEAGNLGQS